MAQCPNCGGYRVRTTLTHIYQGKEVPMITLRLLSQYLIAFAVVYVGGIVLIVNAYVIWGILALLIGGLATLGLFRGIRRQVRLPIKEKHFCSICYNSWMSDPGDLQPAVVGNPDLLRKGEQRLAEEEQLAAQQQAEQQKRLHEGYHYFGSPTWKD